MDENLAKEIQGNFQSIDCTDCESVIKWQTGEPKEMGVYLVTTSSNIIRTSNWVNGHWIINNLPFSPLKIIAWCNLSDIEPYKE